MFHEPITKDGSDDFVPSNPENLSEMHHIVDPVHDACLPHPHNLSENARV